MEIPYEIYQQIGQFLPIRDIVSLMRTGKDISESLREEYFWNDLLYRDFDLILNDDSISSKEPCLITLSNYDI